MRSNVQKLKGRATPERRVWAVAFTAAVVLGTADILRHHVARSSALSTVCLVFVMVAVIVEIIAIFAWVRILERQRSAPDA
jgi:hypothetical protein